MIHTTEILIENVIPYEIYSNFNGLKKCRTNCYSAVYKDIPFRYYFNSSVLLLTVDVLEFMGTDKVCISDLKEFNKKCQQLVFEMIGRRNAQLKINRIDYFVDLYFSEYELKIIENDLMYKHLYRYKYMCVRNLYESSLAVRTKYGQRNISLYDKEQERIDKNDFTGAEKYKGILRIESQIKKRKLKKELKVNGTSQDLENYWSESEFIENYINLFRDFLYVGDYYRIDKAHETVYKSELKDIEKNRLCIFLTRINKVGINGIKNDYAPRTIKHYIELLNSIEVNPLTLNINCKVTYIKSMFKRIKEIAEKEYFK